MSEWQTVDIRKKTKMSAGLSTNGFKIVPMSEFQRCRSMYTEVSFELSELFDHINAMASTSSQYQSSININYNQRNHNIWHQNNSTKEVDMIVLGLLNKASPSNIQHIVDGFKDVVITTYEEMTNVVDKIYTKCIQASRQPLMMTMIIKYIILNYSWIVYDDHCKPITFRKIFVDRMECDFNKIIDSIKSENTSIEIRSTRKSFFQLIGAFFHEEIFGDQLLRFIMTGLENAFLRTRIMEYMDYWIILLIWANKIWTDPKNSYMLEKTGFIIKNKDKFDTRINILMDNYKQVNIEEDPEEIELVEVKTGNIYKDYDLDLLIASTAEYGSLDGWYSVMQDIEKNTSGIIKEIVSILSTKTNDLKRVFELLKFIRKKSDYKSHVDECVSKFLKTTKCELYITNARKLMKKK